jgi:hypothetical protein
MQHGGARSRSGPRADPLSARSELRAKRDGWTDLPAKHSGRAPAWPLEKKRASEEELWKALWKRPQAAMWKKRGLEWQVALYARSFLEAAEHGAPASLKTSVLRMEDGLGISEVGLTALRWRIVEDEVAAKRSAPVREAVEAAPAAPVRRLRRAASE